MQQITLPGQPNPYLFLERNAHTWPKELGLVTTRSELTWSELKFKVDRIASKLRFHGLRPGDVCVLLTDKETSWLLQLALFHEGAISVVPSGPNQIPSSVKVKWIFSPSLVSGFDTNKTVIVNQAWMDEAISRFKSQEMVMYQSFDDPMVIALSSGTTGTPKAMNISLGILVGRSEKNATYWSYPVGHSCLMGFSSLVGWMHSFRTLMAGKTTYQLSLKDEGIWDFIVKHRLASLMGSPVQLSGLLDRKSANVDVSNLRVVISGGSVLPKVLEERLRKDLEVEIWNGYGSTEAGGVAWKEITPNSDPSVVGRIRAGVEILTLDENNSPLEAGASGKIAVKAPFMVDGYIENEEANASAFIDGWFLSGDMGRVKDGNLILEGRSSEIINAGGSKINPDVIDNFILSQKTVKDAASFAFVDDQGIDWPVVAIVPRDSQFKMKNLVDASTLALGRMGPKLYIIADSIPRNQNGKVVRGKLAEESRSQILKLISSRIKK